MNWTQWVIALALGFAAGASGVYLYPRWGAVRRAAVPYWRYARRRLQALARRLGVQPAPQPRPSIANRPRPDEDPVVLMPDGRPWPLGPALQLLEFAWRWQVVHGANLPLRARQGEGAYVWRPPLPVRSNAGQPGAEVEH